MKILLIIALLIFFSVAAGAQHKIVFSSQNYAGILVGENKTNYQFQSINGIKYKTWFSGIGMGIDGYYVNSIPLFVSINKELFKKKSGFYLSADAGINFGCPTINQRRAEESDFDAGLYLTGGLGYKIGIGKTNALLVYTGYSSKHLIEKVISFPADAPQMDKYDYYLRRISLKIGWSF